MIDLQPVSRSNFLVDRLDVVLRSKITAAPYADQLIHVPRRRSFGKDLVAAVLRIQAKAALLPLPVSMLPDFVQIIPEEDPENAGEQQAEQHQSDVHSAGRNRRLSMRKGAQPHIKERAEVDSVLLHAVGLDEKSAQLRHTHRRKDERGDSEDPRVNILEVSSGGKGGTGRKEAGRLARTMMRMMTPPPVVDRSNSDVSPRM